MDEYALSAVPIFRACPVNISNNNTNNSNNTSNSNCSTNNDINMHQTNQLHPPRHPYNVAFSNQHQHHHKDYMLAAGSTPSTTFLYETSHSKPNMIMAKNDYATYASSTQQSVTLLDSHVNTDTNMETNLETTESMTDLNSVRNLKFSHCANGNGKDVAGSNCNIMSVERINTDSTSNFKSLPLLPIIEDNNLLVSGGNCEDNISGSGSGSGDSVYDSGDDSLNKTDDICDNIVAQISKFSQLKSVQNTSHRGNENDLLKTDNYMDVIKPAVVPFTATQTTAATVYRSGETTKHTMTARYTEPTSALAPFSDIMITDSCNAHLLGFDMASSANSITDESMSIMSAVTTTETIISKSANRFSIAATATTNLKTNVTTANSNNCNNNNINGNIIAPTTLSSHIEQLPAANEVGGNAIFQCDLQQKHQHQQQLQYSHNNLACNLRSIKHIETHTNTPQICDNRMSSSSIISKKDNILSNSITPAAKDISSTITTSAAGAIKINNVITVTTTNTVALESSTITTVSSLKKCHSEWKCHQQSENIARSTVNDTSDNDDISSSGEEFLASDLNDTGSEFMAEDKPPVGSGYQDTTSSHSQHSSNNGGTGSNGGGGVGGGGGQTNLTIPNCVAGPASGVSLVNGIVTLNSQLSGNGAGSGDGSGCGGGSSGGNTINSSNNGSSSSSSYMSLLPPAVGATSSSGPHLAAVNALGGTSTLTTASTADVIDIKQLFEELCPVCGDKVSGYHYGLLTCESCKGFFKRTVQNKKVYTCVAERSCHIDKTQRKRCPYCRFQKCLDVGMKLEAVRADRMRGGRNKFGPMYKRDRARKLQVMRQRQIALQALRTMSTNDMKSTPLSPAGYQQAYTNMNIKQEIQIPQVSSLTQSPDSSPSPIAIALGQIQCAGGVIATPQNGNSSTASGAGSNNGLNSGIGGGGAGGSVSGEGINSIGGNGNSNNQNNNNNNNSNNNEGINRVGNTGSGNSCHESGTTISLQNASDSKLCFDSGTHPSSTADSIIEPPLRVSPMIREFVQSIDDREWQTQLFALLQKQTYNQVEVDLFELMCKVLDQNLFSQVDWARNTVFFKDLKVDDQMKLLQHSWSDMLVLDHLHQRIHNGLPDETQLNNGQIFNLLNLGLLGVTALTDYFNEIQTKLQDLKFDMGDYVCMKFLILLNPDVHGIINKKAVLRGYQNVQGALLDYNLTCYQSVTDKFQKLLNILPEIHALAARGEEHLYTKHCAGSAPTQTLLMEMLHAKRKV